MIKIIDGYEIDGSDTAFNLVTDSKDEILGLIRFLFDLPVFDKHLPITYNDTGHSYAPHRNWSEGQKNFVLSERSVLLEKITAAILDSKDISLCFQILIPILLPNDIKKELLKLTETRPGGKRENMGMHNPSGALLRESYEGNSVGLIVTFKKEKPSKKPKGMILNNDSLEKYIGKPAYCIKLTCGPGFYYEYAAWIMERIAKQFPSVGIDGGLDCGGGFTDGCTYANTIYAFERIALPWKKACYAIEKLYPKFIDLPGLEKKNILTNNLSILKQQYKSKETMSQYLSAFNANKGLGLESYQEFCTMLYSDDALTNEELIVATAVNILWFGNEARPMFKGWDLERDNYQRKGYIACTRKDGHVASELWVRKEYFDDANNIIKSLV